MKKILIGCFILSAMSFANTLNNTDKYLEVKAGWDINAEYDSIDISGAELIENDAKSDGFELALEGMMKYNNNLDLGIGIAYQDHADRKTANPIVFNVDGADYDSIPIYFVAKYKFNPGYNYVPYLKANLGYSFNFDENDIVGKAQDGSIIKKVGVSIDDGMYFAIGGGLEYDSFTVDLMYGIVKADISLIENTLKNNKYSADYEKLTLSVGYKFDI